MVATSNGTVRLQTWQLLSMIGGIIVGTLAIVVTFYAQIHALDASFDASIKAADDKWEMRIERVVVELKKDIRDVRNAIPPDWFKSLVDSHTKELASLRSEISSIRTKCDVHYAPP